MLRRARLIGFAFAVFAIASRAADSSGNRYARVEIASTKTSIYIGTVSMTMPTFTRANGTFESTYVAKVFPFFFSSEKGRLGIDVSDEQVQKLARGEAIEFTGNAVNSNGEERRIEGKATPVRRSG